MRNRLIKTILNIGIDNWNKLDANGKRNAIKENLKAKVHKSNISNNVMLDSIENHNIILENIDNQLDDNQLDDNQLDLDDIIPNDEDIDIEVKEDANEIVSPNEEDDNDEGFILDSNIKDEVDEIEKLLTIEEK